MDRRVLFGMFEMIKFNVFELLLFGRVVVRLRGILLFLELLVFLRLRMGVLVLVCIVMMSFFGMFLVVLLFGFVEMVKIFRCMFLLEWGGGVMVRLFMILVGMVKLFLVFFVRMRLFVCMMVFFGIFFN